ncbi:oxidoreductase [Byssothecium circinans]|uniref:Oxidoreductase n=1 Tax=Byssothecium circinans TaxID=147558 RepID=A0A6A5UFY7_9PLEO|nr:oxidoreductase [Byssothecium circinans]
MSLNILIIGSGIAGPALALLLQRSNVTNKHTITLIERSPALRLAGQQIDIKAQAIPILRKMGVLATLKSLCVNETGLEMLDKNDKIIAQFGVTPAGKRGLTLTSEYEIMRGDVVKVLVDDSQAQRTRVETQAERKGKDKAEGSLTYEFSKDITAIEHSTSPSPSSSSPPSAKTTAKVTFSTGEIKTYDLVIGADGLNSKTRRLAFGTASTTAFKSLGIHSAYYSIPRLSTEGSLARGYITQNRFLLTRTSDRPVTGVYLFSTSDFDGIRESYKLPIKQQKAVWAKNLEGAGWQAPRFAEELGNTQDFYAHEQAQIKMEELYKRRVVLLGDSGYCPSPFTGLGATLALVGAYVLAGELARNGNDVDKALVSYQRVVRPYIDEAQQLPLGGLGALFPSSRWGVWVLKGVFKAVSWSGIERLMTRMSGADKKGEGMALPVYDELVLEEA